MTVTSDNAELVLGSDRLKLMVAVSPAASVVLLLLTMMVGGAVSPALGVSRPLVPAGRPRLRLTPLLGSVPSWLALPAASVKRLLSTRIRPLLAPALGVKVAM